MHPAARPKPTPPELNARYAVISVALIESKFAEDCHCYRCRPSPVSSGTAAVSSTSHRPTSSHAAELAQLSTLTSV
jgi:hypothetical protein